MNNLKLETTNGEPNEEDKETIKAGMLAYHKSKGHPRKMEYVSILIKDDNDSVLGAIVVSFLWNGMHIDTLWVDKSIRSQGWGRKLIEAAEEEAIQRHCTVSFTDTFTWQAPGFYEKLGYTEFGKVENFPEGNSLIYYKKEL